MFEETFRKNDDVTLSEAEYFFHHAYELQMQGATDEAILNYRKSLDVHPTAEAFTFLGWALSEKGMYDDAIQACQEAITIDPAFGNPYNDIGAYLISQKLYDEAVPWLVKALEAKRYDSRHYPHYNLGRVHEVRGRWVEALMSYRQALELAPQYDLARQAVARMQTLWSRRN